MSRSVRKSAKSFLGPLEPWVFDMWVAAGRDAKACVIRAVDEGADAFIIDRTGHAVDRTKAIFIADGERRYLGTMRGISRVSCNVLMFEISHFDTGPFIRCFVDGHKQLAAGSSYDFTMAITDIGTGGRSDELAIKSWSGRA